MAVKVHVHDCRTDARVADELESIFDIGRGKNACAGLMQCIVQLKRDQGLIFDDEHAAPQQWANGTHDTIPSSAKPERRRGMRQSHRLGRYGNEQNLWKIQARLTLGVMATACKFAIYHTCCGGGARSHLLWQRCPRKG